MTTKTTPEAAAALAEKHGGKTGWPAGTLQDDCKGLSRWLSMRPDSRMKAREAANHIRDAAKMVLSDARAAAEAGKEVGG